MKRTPKQFAIALYEAATGKKGKELEGIIFNFVKILQKENKLNWGNKIITALEKHARQQEKIEEIEITSAKPLATSLILRIKKQLCQLEPKRLGEAKKILIKEKHDPAILGGIMIMSGDQVWDMTLKKQLHLLKTKLASA